MNCLILVREVQSGVIPHEIDLFLVYHSMSSTEVTMNDDDDPP